MEAVGRARKERDLLPGGKFPFFERRRVIAADRIYAPALIADLFDRPAARRRDGKFIPRDAVSAKLLRLLIERADAAGFDTFISLSFFGQVRL